MSKPNHRSSAGKPQNDGDGEKTVYVLLVEAESRDIIDEATEKLSDLKGLNYMQYNLGDSYLRIVLSALRQAAVSSS